VSDPHAATKTTIKIRFFMSSPLCIALTGHVDSAMIRRIYHQGSNSSFDQVARTLPNLSANMRHDNVVPIGKASELGELDSDAVEGNT
jgi:hypothetical protein